MEQNGIKRKISLSRKSAAPAEVRGAAKAWRLALARAAHETMGLELGLVEMGLFRRSLAELLEIPTERALIVILEGPKDGLGLLIISPDVLAGLLEMQMVGKVSTAPPLSRRPTRTDAAMVSGFIDKALNGLEAALLQSCDLVWASGFHYASFLEDARPLALLLEDIPYQFLEARVSLSEGAKNGKILLALPADGKGRQPKSPEAPAPSRAAEMVFGAALGEQVMEASADLIAVLARVKLPLDMVLGLRPGDPLPLGRAALDQIDMEGLDGTRLAGGRLGQNRGMRAVRLLETSKPAAVSSMLLKTPPPKGPATFPSTDIQKAG